jgi:pimeloyl-ACP methyl ester carboxylesterase
MDGTVMDFRFLFHRVPDLPEALIAEKERLYLKHFVDKLSYYSGAIGRAELDVYAADFEQPGAIRAGVSLYRAFDEDAEENRADLEKSGKCKVRCLVLNGDLGYLSKGAEGMGKETYEDFQVTVVPEADHYIAEEIPEGFVQAVLDS